MSELRKILTPDQRRRIKRIAGAFERDFEERDPFWEAKRILLKPEQFEQATLDTLKDIGPDYSALAEFEPDPRSEYRNGAELLADVEALQRDGLL